MNTLMRDIRFALRSLLKNPAFALAAVLSLAIGIGANTSIFSVANALLFRPLPYENPDRLVILWNRSPGLNISEDWFSTAQYFDIKTGHSGFEEVAIAKRSKCVSGFGCGAEIDGCARAIAQLQMPGYEIGVQV